MSGWDFFFLFFIFGSIFWGLLTWHHQINPQLQGWSWEYECIARYIYTYIYIYISSSSSSIGSSSVYGCWVACSLTWSPIGCYNKQNDMDRSIFLLRTCSVAYELNSCTSTFLTANELTTLIMETVVLTLWNIIRKISDNLVLKIPTFKHF